MHLVAISSTIRPLRSVIGIPYSEALALKSPARITLPVTVRIVPLMLACFVPSTSKLSFGEITTYIRCIPERGPNVAIAFPFLGQGRVGSASEPHDAVASVIGKQVLVVHVVRMLD